MRRNIHTILFYLFQKNDPGAVKDQQVSIQRLMLLAIFRYNIPNDTNYNIIILPKTFMVAVRCTKEGNDPWRIPCCTGLYKTEEPRPASNAVYCPSSDPMHNKKCWSTQLVCRSSGSSLIWPLRGKTFIRARNNIYCKFWTNVFYRGLPWHKISHRCKNWYRRLTYQYCDSGKS